MIEVHVLGPTRLRRDGADVHSILAQPERLALPRLAAHTGGGAVALRERGLREGMPNGLAVHRLR